MADELDRADSGSASPDPETAPTTSETASATSGAAPPQSEPASAAFVLGLDGVPWALIERWTAEGELPNFERLVEEGASGPLESTTPATTPLAWPSIATGVRPDKHGIYGWRDLSPSYSHRMYTGSDAAGPFLWDLLSPAVVGNVPMTYPAREIGGAMVAGLMTPEIGEGFASPPELRAEIEERVPEYEIGLYWEDYDGPTEEFLGDLQSLVENRRALMRLLLEHAGEWTEDWRLCFFVYTAPDRLQHLVWEEDVLLEHYRYLDGIVGEAMDAAAERHATLYVVSDHGFGPIHTHVAVNRALADAGLLVAREDSGARSTLEGVGITRESVLGALERVGVDQKTLLSHLPRSLVDSVATRIPGDNVLYDVDFAETAAFAHGPGNVYVNDAERFEDGAVAPEDVPAIKRDVAGLLRSLSDPETGEPVLEVVDGDEAFPTDPTSPDLAIEGRAGYEVVTGWRDREVFEDAGTMAAGHRPEGIVLAWGPSIQAGATPADATVYDVAPTLLHDLGEPVPDRVDGRVLSELFERDAAPAREGVRTEPTAGGGGGASSEAEGAAGDDSGAEASEEDMTAVEDRLRGLGYME